MEISHHATWRRSIFFCDDTTIDSSVLFASGSLVCREGCSGTVGSMSVYCTDYGIANGWSNGGRSYNYTFASGVTQYEAS